jgi:hypothetical protein
MTSKAFKNKVCWSVRPTYLKNPPKGIIACGEEDERLGASLSYFLYGRKVNRQWT